MSHLPMRPDCSPEGTTMNSNPIQLTRKRRGLLRRAGVALTTLGLGAHIASAQVTVTTVGGGPITPEGPANGFINGPTLQESQFNHPAGCALDSLGFLYVADRDNGQVRRLDLPGDRAWTHLSGLSAPVALVFDGADNLYVACRGDGTVRKFDKFINPIAIHTGLGDLTAIALDGSTNVYVTSLTGTIQRITPSGQISTVFNGLIQPRGIAIMDSGLLAVSEEHAIRLVDIATTTWHYLSGTNAPGFTNGPAYLAKFDQPRQIAKAPNGSLVVADYANHRVRVVTTNGLTTTLYGVSPTNWVSDYPGWEDGSTDYVEAREPLGIAVDPKGVVYTTEGFYHIVRRVTGAGLEGGTGGGPGGGDGGTNEVVVIPPPTFSPTSGYYPMGQRITVTSPFADVRYTLDGTTPTTNSLRLSMTNNQGIITWRETLKDLTALRLRVFNGTNASDVVGGVPSPRNEIGVTRDVQAGIGASAVVPVVMNLKPDQRLRSVQFRVEMAPNPGTQTMIPDLLRVLPVSTNDFIRVVTTSDSAGSATFHSSSYRIGDARGVAISFIGTNANFTLERFGVVAMLSIPVPPQANVGDSYRIKVLEVSGTADGVEAPVEPELMTVRNLVVANLPYVVGDSALAGWYNAGDFGSGDLKNNDVNHAFTASFGVRVPHPLSDLFNAMDAFPEDQPGQAGGDGQIRYLDWQLILQRSLRLQTDNWQRVWSPGGVRLPARHELPSSAAVPAESGTLLPGSVWARPALLGATAIERALPNTVVELPVYVRLAADATLAGMQFKATVAALGTSPDLVEAVQFVPEAGVPMPRSVDGLALNQVACAWNLGDFDPPLAGDTVLGYLRVKLPVHAPIGRAYEVQFSYADGSPDLHTQYDFESLAASIWVHADAVAATPPVSIEWQTHFFGNPAAAPAAPGADPDGDGEPNWAEYAAGTHPLDARSRLALEAQPADATGLSGAGFRLRWLSAPGKTYTVECTSELSNRDWNVVARDIPGTGAWLDLLDTNLQHPAQYYRLRLSP